MNWPHYSFLICLCSLIGCIPSHRFHCITEVSEAALENAVSEASLDPLFFSAEPLSVKWWEIFHDEQLNDLIEIALLQNPSFQISKTRILLALSQALQSKSALYPSIGFEADVQRMKLSKTGVFPSTVEVPGLGITPAPVVPGLIPFSFTQYETSINFSYDLDLWGKNRNLYLGRLGEVQAKKADACFSALVISASVAEAYFQLQIDFEREKIAKELYENRRAFSSLTAMRIENHLDSRILANSADYQVSQAKINLLQREATEKVDRVYLEALLATDFQKNIFPISIAKSPLPSLPLPCNLPFHLLYHRADILANLWMIESLGHSIYVAKAGFYPDFNLLGFFGFQTLNFSKLFQWASSYGDAEAQVTLPLFDAGLLEAKLEEAYFKYDLAILQYNDSIIQATKEVLESFTLLLKNKEQLDEYQKETQYQEEVFKLVQLKVSNNLESEVSALDAKSNYLLALDQELIAQGKVLSSMIRLMKSLGGGYETRNTPKCEDREW